MSLFLVLIILALIGCVNAWYLVSMRIHKQIPICPMKGDCVEVFQSKFNKTFGVYNEVWGFLYFFGVSVWALSFYILVGVLHLPIDPPGQLNTLGTTLLTALVVVGFFTAIAFLMTLRLLYIQFFVMKKKCFWCVLSSLCVIATTIVFIILCTVPISTVK